MAIQLRTTLKGYFQTGNIPVEQHYVDFIDSTLNISESNSGNIDLIGNISMSGNISSSGTTGTHTLGGDLFVANDITASRNISASGALTGSGINILGNITASGNIKCGELDIGGELSATNVDFTYISGSRLTLSNPNSQLSLGGTILATTFTELNYLDGITSNNGTYVKAMNQSVATSASPTFVSATFTQGITLGKTALGAGTYGSTTNTEGFSFTLTITSIPTIPAKGDLLTVAKSTPTQITNSSVEENHVIIGAARNVSLSVSCFNIRNGSFEISLANETTEAFSEGSAVFNFVVL